MSTPTRGSISAASLQCAGSSCNRCGCCGEAFYYLAFNLAVFAPYHPSHALLPCAYFDLPTPSPLRVSGDLGYLAGIGSRVVCFVIFDPAESSPLKAAGGVGDLAARAAAQDSCFVFCISQRSAPVFEGCGSLRSYDCDHALQ